MLQSNILLVTLYNMEAGDGTLVGAAIGFVVTVLLLWGTQVKRTEIFGHAILFAAISYYLSGLVIATIVNYFKQVLPSRDRTGIAVLISGVGGTYLGPVLKDIAPRVIDKLLSKKVGLDD